MLKIAHVFTTFYPGLNAHARTFAIAADQQKRGWQVEFVTGRNASPDLIREKQQQGFPVHQVANLRKYIHPCHDLKALVELVRLFRRRKFDLVHTHLAKAGILGRLAARLAGVRIVVHSVYGATFAPTLPLGKQLLFWGLEKLAGKVTDQFIFIGQDLRDAFIRAGICSAQKAAVIYGGRDLSPFIAAACLSEKDRQARRRAAGLDPQTIVLGNVARIVPWKGHDYALQAFNELKKQYPQIKMIIVGDTKVPSEQGHKNKLIAKAKSLGFEKDVIFTGWQKDTARYYSIFDIYVLTSMPFEGVPGSVLEATASGLPVVGFECFGLREILVNNARLVPVKDVAGLTRALKKAIDQLPETRRRRGQNLSEIQKLQKQFSVDRMLAETGQLYNRLLANKKKTRNLKE